MSGQNSKPVLLIGATLLLVLVVITVLQRVSRKQLVRTIPPHELSIMSEWDAAKFIDVAEALLHTNWLDDIPTTNTIAISEEQSLALRKCLITCVTAFSSGSYDDYRAFVTPIPLPFRSNRMASIRKFLRDPSSSPTIGLTPKIKDVRAVNQVLTHGSPEEIHRTYFRVASKNTSYKDYWQGIAAASSWVTTFSASALPTDLMDLLFDRMQNLGAF